MNYMICSKMKQKRQLYNTHDLRQLFRDIRIQMKRQFDKIESKNICPNGHWEISS